MKTQYLIAAAVGIAAGYFLAAKLAGNQPWAAAYLKGIAAAS